MNKRRIHLDIRNIDAFGNEYWYARELMPLLEYNKWENFHKVIKRVRKDNNNLLNNKKVYHLIHFL